MAKAKKTAGTKPIRLGIWGMGRAGLGMHCEEIKNKTSLYQIVAACDILPERLNLMADKYGCRTYKNAKEFLADPAIEMVSIATRSCDHLQHAIQALKAGKHVFLEKPMTLTYAEAKKLQAAAKKAKGNLYIRHNRRFEPCFQHIREIIASGILGEVFEIKLRRVQFQRRDDWQTLKRFGGGQLLNWGPHIIDHGLRLLEAPLKHLWSDLKCVAAAGDAEDHLKIVMTGKNGRIVDIEISGGAAISEPEYLVWGTKGALSAAGNTITLKYLDPKKKLAPRKPNPGTPGVGVFGSPDPLPWLEKTIEVKPAKKVDMTIIWDEMYLALRHKAKFPITLDEAVAVMQVVSAVKKGTRFA